MSKTKSPREPRLPEAGMRIFPHCPEKVKTDRKFMFLCAPMISTAHLSKEDFDTLENRSKSADDRILFSTYDQGWIFNLDFETGDDIDAEIAMCWLSDDFWDVVHG